MTPALEDRLDALLRDRCLNEWAALELKRALLPLLRDLEVEARRDQMEADLVIIDRNLKVRVAE